MAKLDALTLQPVSKAVRTGSAETTYVARSPGRGTRAAFAAFPSLRFLDLKKMRWEYRLGYPGVPAASVWNYAGTREREEERHRLESIRTLDRLGHDRGDRLRHGI